MRLPFHLNLLTTLLFLFLSSSLTSARFFPNISSIPPWLNSTSAAGSWSTFLNLTGCKLGENLSGISKLKRYFHQFGYIPNTQLSNFTDDFDDALESAIKTYQRNFNIDATGQLDLKTLQQIIKPRCGNADIVNGSTTMNSEKTTATSLHSVAHYSFFPGAPRWPESRRDLTYAFFPGNTLSDTVKGVFAGAFQRWAQVIPMTFTETPDFSGADIQIGFFQGEHGDGEPFDGAFGTLAHAFSPPSGRFHLDGDENWVVSGDEGPSRFSSAVDLESVAVHEIGHLLGLGHSSVEDSIMYPTITSGMKRVQLHSDDIEGIQSLYGSNPNFNGSTTPAGGGGRERDTASNSGASGSDFRFGFGVLVAVGSAMLIL